MSSKGNLTNKKTKKRLFSISYKDIGIIVLSAILGLLVGLGVGVIVEKPIYIETASLMFIVEADSSADIGYYIEDISLSKDLLPNVEKILEGDDFARTVNEVYKKKGGVGEIVSKNIEIERAKNDTLIFTISYTDEDQELVGKKLEIIVSEASRYLSNKLNTGNIQLKETSNVNDREEVYNYKPYIIIGAVVGLLISLGVFSVKYLLDNTVKDKAELEEITGVKVLACIQERKNKE